MNEQPTTPTPTTPATPAATPTPTAPATPVFTPELNPAQAETMAAWIREDVAAGKLTPEQAEKAFNELSTPVENRTDGRSPVAKELDEAGFAPAAKPEDYVIHWGQEMTPELKQFDTAARSAWLHGAGFPRELGNSLVHQISKVIQRNAGKTPAQLDAEADANIIRLQGVHGDTLPEKFAAANKMIHELEAKQPGLKRLLTSHGVGDDPITVNLLLAQAERYWARKRG